MDIEIIECLNIITSFQTPKYHGMTGEAVLQTYNHLKFSYYQSLIKNSTSFASNIYLFG